MPRSPLSKIAQGAFSVDKCPVEKCKYIPKNYADFVRHMWRVHNEDVHDWEGDK